MTKVVVTRSCGNVFADLGLPEPEEELVKAQFLVLVEQAARRRRLSHAAIADLTGVNRSKVSALLAGRGGGMSCGQLMQMLTRLGYDIDITIKPTRRGRSRGQLRVPREVPREAMVKARNPARGRSRSTPSGGTLGKGIILPI